jgi:hypothetical protein
MNNKRQLFGKINNLKIFFDEKRFINNKCFRMGELEQWQDEVYIQQLWFNLNEKVMVKVIRDKVTG